MLGYDMTNAMKNFVARSGGDNATGNCYNTTSEPSQWWDISIQIP